jgi:major vault protein
VLGPEPMITVPPRHFCIVANPVVRTDDGVVVTSSEGQVKLRHGDQEIRFSQAFPEPFALYPGESTVGPVKQLQLVPPNTALRLRALRDVTLAHEEGGEPVAHVAGDEWLFRGPGTYIPRVEVQVAETISATIVRPNQALKLRARAGLRDCYGTERKAGEEWLMREVGAYVQASDEVIVETLEAYVLTDKKALHVEASRTFTDALGKRRKAGEKWLVTIDDCETFIPDVYETVIEEIRAVTLTSLQYCVVLDPVDPATGKQQFGKRELRKGEATFFLRPGETLEAGIQNVFVLGMDEALLLRATEEFPDIIDGTEGKRKPGDRWMIRGPLDFVPSVECEIVERRSAIALDDNEGIYVRDIYTGKVRAIIGETYMLKAHEELWEKDLPKAVEDLLAKDLDPLSDRQAYLTEGNNNNNNNNGRRGGGGGGGAGGDDDGGGKPLRKRDKTRVVTYRAPHNSAVQVYDYRAKRSRVVFGPDLVKLMPDEQFTVLSLSGDKPKRPNVIKSIGLLLGPDFMTDIITVETSDHARLQLQLSYNWYFDINAGGTNGEEGVSRIFQVPDFVGDACKAIASRVRGAVAAVPFDQFHRTSARIIRQAVFGVDDDGKVKGVFTFPQNGLCMTNIDIQSVEPVDQKTRDSLQKSVQLAIEITTKSQEAAARHEAERIEQEARGRLERQKIEDEAKAETSRRDLLSLQAESAAVESTGQASAEAKARAEAAQIESAAAVKQAELRAQASDIEAKSELQALRARQNAEIEYQRSLNELEMTKSKELAEIESAKFKALIDAIGADTIAEIARAGPEMQAKLLGGLGLQGYLITDGTSPINLMGTAQGLLGGAASGAGGPGAPGLH